MVNVFFSYSHKDEDLRNELEIHLSMLKRQGVISTWHDRRIGAGKEVDHEISRYLETADIILLLVSPYFLNSDYCYDIEMHRAMERHEKGEARVIPIILHPCDWHHAPFGKLMAMPTDGKPVSKFPNLHDAFLEVTRAIRQATGELGAAVPARSVKSVPNPAAAVVTEKVRSSNLRIKESFSDRDKDRFLEEAFEYIANFFEGSLAELKVRNPEIDTTFRRIDANHFTAVIYKQGSAATQCKIWLGGRRSFPGGIAYSASVHSGDNSYNESLSVEDDGFTLFLKPLGMVLRGSGQEQQLTLEGGAEYLWQLFIEPLQR